jgi:beta-aspartyl-peptidase (threonine type)
MNERPEPAGSVAALVGALILAILIVGGGLYFYFTRHLTAIQARAAMVAEARARAEAERARANELLLRQAAKEASVERATADVAAKGEILGVLEAQRILWNAGDIPGFMEHYWKSDELTFNSGGKTTRGWQATLERYQSRYPTPEKMGTLEFNECEVFPLGESAALVLGQWKLTREPDPIGGNFSIVFRKIEGHWRIVHDHTSVLEPETQPDDAAPEAEPAEAQPAEAQSAASE